MTRSERKYRHKGYFKTLLKDSTQEKGEDGKMKIIPKEFDDIAPFKYEIDSRIKHQKETIGRFQMTGSDMFIWIPEKYKSMLVRKSEIYLSNDFEKKDGYVLDWEEHPEDDSTKTRQRGNARYNVKYLVHIG